MIPAKFLNGPFPTACTVGGLKAALAELPDGLRLATIFDEAVELRVHDHDLPSAVLVIDAAEEDEG